MSFFTVDERERVRDRVVEMASSDARVVAAAVIGSLAHGAADRWSDLDLTFGVAERVPVTDVLEEWTRTLADEFAAVTLFDLTSGQTLYRVFLLPGCLQVDLSFTPESAFGAAGPNFRLLFGDAVEKPRVPPPPADELFGYAVHHALRARFCIERGRFWQAEYWISGVRDYALSLACVQRGLPPHYGRGFDALPPDVHDSFRDALVRSLDPAELMRALGVAITGLRTEADELAERIEPQLRLLAEP